MPKHCIKDLNYRDPHIPTKSKGCNAHQFYETRALGLKELHCENYSQKLKGELILIKF